MDTKDNSEKLYPGIKIAGSDPAQAETEEVPREQRSAPRLRPNGDLVLLRRLEKNEKTKGGIILPAGVQSCFFRAEVLAIGQGHAEGNQMVPPADCKAGDIVLVQDEQERRGPQGQSLGVVQKHLIPVTPDDKQFVLCPGRMIYAVELGRKPDAPTAEDNETPMIDGVRQTHLDRMSKRPTAIVDNY